jgi:aryl-alcohol dehydrogenase-like predicted oxidoreductase
MLTGKYATDTTFPDDDVRASWPREYLLMQVQLVEKLRFLVTAGTRTLAQAALRFVLDEPAVSVVIPGIKTSAQAEENIASSNLPPLSESDRQTLRELLGEAMDDLLL